MKLILVALAMTILSSTLRAECQYNGQAYPEGTVLGPMICSDGRWQQR